MVRHAGPASPICAGRRRHEGPPCRDATPQPHAPLPISHVAAEYEAWLSRGTAGFQPPSEASRRALESESSLSIGAKKLPVEAGLRPAALDLSRALALDEVQAYILLRRWVAKAGPAALLPAAGAGGGASLSPDQRLEVAELYLNERLCLLESIERLLWEGERERRRRPCSLLRCRCRRLRCPRPARCQPGKGVRACSRV